LRGGKIETPPPQKKKLFRAVKGIFKEPPNFPQGQGSGSVRILFQFPLLATKFFSGMKKTKKKQKTARRFEKFDFGAQNQFYPFFFVFPVIKKAPSSEQKLRGGREV